MSSDLRSPSSDWQRFALRRFCERMSLERFHEAQASRWAGYDAALAEIRAGGKRSHWIWYIFPQIEGLGHSSTARAYAIRDLGEACAYLRDPTLRARYEEIAAAVSEELPRDQRRRSHGRQDRRAETGFQSDSFPRRGRTTRTRGSGLRLA